MRWPLPGRRPRAPLRRRLLQTAQIGLWSTGVASVYAGRSERRAAVALMYHSVGSDPCWVAPGNRVSTEVFEKQMRFIARRRRAVGIDELEEAIRGDRPLPAGAVLLTFDDGYRDNLDVAAPILQRLKLPAVLYLATSYVDRAESQWADELYGMLLRAESHDLTLEGRRFDLRRPDGPSGAYDHAAGLLLPAPPGRRREILDTVRGQLRPVAAPPRSTLDWDEVREIRDRYPDFRIGVHTAEHTDLTSLGEDDALDDVRRSVRRFEEELGFPPRHFSFPYCRVHEAVRRRLPELGLTTAMSTEGVIRWPERDALDIRRFEPLERSLLLRYWTSGAHPELSRRLFRKA